MHLPFGERVPTFLLGVYIPRRIAESWSRASVHL